MNEVIIRPISESDDAAMAHIIRQCLLEYNAPAEGSALGDPEIDFMARAYSGGRAAYFVAELNGLILGGAGIAQLENADAAICELRKMYLSGQARGKGIGSRLIEASLQKAAGLGYAFCYLETFPSMEAAQKLYLKTGFDYIKAPLGGTGHTACTIWMLKPLNHAD